MSSIPPLDSSNSHLQALQQQQAAVRNTSARPRGADEATESNHSPAEDAAEQVQTTGKQLNVKPVNQSFNSLA